jgi:dienelactone hydrolase
MTPDLHDPSTGTGAECKDHEHLGRFSNWVEFAVRQDAVPRWQRSEALAPAQVRDLLGFATDQPPIDPRRERTWTGEGVIGEEVSWWVGYGPRTNAWLLRPAGTKGRLPGVLALHDHSNFKFFGKEKIADGPDAPHPLVVDLRRREYEGRAFANELAKEGFTVLVHDTFLWGSRGFTLDEMVPPEVTPASDVEWLPETRSQGIEDGASSQSEFVRLYNRAAASHEHMVAKYCNLLGTSLAGVVAYEDRMALAYLKSQTEIVSESVGCIGLSGGGLRAVLLQATSPDIAVSVVVGMMSTYDKLLDRHVAPHTWMLFPPALARVADWPEVAACRAPSPLVVQYTRGDHLFPLEGMVAAHQYISERYLAAGAPEAYLGQFFDGQHWFDRGMQKAAFQRLSECLTR